MFLKLIFILTLLAGPLMFMLFGVVQEQWRNSQLIQISQLFFAVYWVGCDITVEQILGGLYKKQQSKSDPLIKCDLIAKCKLWSDYFEKRGKETQSKVYSTSGNTFHNR